MFRRKHANMPCITGRKDSKFTIEYFVTIYTTLA